MSIYTVKRYSLYKFIGLSFAIIYGFFIVGSLQYLYSVGSGDINAYIDFFEDIDIFTMYNEYSIRGDGVFRVLVIFIGNYFNLEPITVLSYFAFYYVIFDFLHICNTYQIHKYLIYILPIFLMIFFTPMVSNLFASGIRSGISFTILMIYFHIL